MTVAELCNELQNVAHSGDAQKEVKNVAGIDVKKDGVYIITKNEVPGKYEIRILCDMTPNPTVPTSTKYIKL